MQIRLTSGVILVTLTLLTKVIGQDNGRGEGRLGFSQVGFNMYPNHQQNQQHSVQYQVQHPDNPAAGGLANAFWNKPAQNIAPQHGTAFQRPQNNPHGLGQASHREQSHPHRGQPQPQQHQQPFQRRDDQFLQRNQGQLHQHQHTPTLQHHGQHHQHQHNPTLQRQAQLHQNQHNPQHQGHAQAQKRQDDGFQQLDFRPAGHNQEHPATSAPHAPPHPNHFRTLNTRVNQGQRPLQIQAQPQDLEAIIADALDQSKPVMYF